MGDEKTPSQPRAEPEAREVAKRRRDPGNREHQSELYVALRRYDSA
jgi:hypothetical protein